MYICIYIHIDRGVNSGRLFQGYVVDPSDSKRWCRLRCRVRNWTYCPAVYKKGVDTDGYFDVDPLNCVDKVC